MRGIWAEILSRDCMGVWRQGPLNSKLRGINFILEVREALFQTGKQTSYHFISWKEVLGNDQAAEIHARTLCCTQRRRHKELEAARHNWLSLGYCLLARRGNAPSSAHSDCWPKIALHLLWDACKIISASKETTLIGVDFSWPPFRRTPGDKHLITEVHPGEPRARRYVAPACPGRPAIYLLLEKGGPSPGASCPAGTCIKGLEIN